MKKKNILRKVLLVAGLVGGSVALASCNNLPQQTTTTPTPATTETTPTTSSTTPAPTTTSTTPVVEKFTVTFDSKGGSAVQAVEVNAGSAVAKPTDPTKSGEKFVGWFTSTDNGTTLSSTAYDFTQAVNSNLTLYALWGNYETATLTIHDNPNDATATREVTVTLNRKSGNVWYGIPELADPTDDYKEFAGWFSDSTLQTPAEITEGIEEDTEIWAKWNPQYEEVTAGFNKDGGNGFVSWNDLASAAGFTYNVVTTEEKEYGAFKFGTGLKIQDETCINTQGKKITITLTGSDNEIHLDKGKWGSGTAGKIHVDEIVDGQTVSKYTSEEYKNGNETDKIDLKSLKAGTYQIYGEKSLYIYSLSIVQKLEKAPVTGFEYTATETEFLANTLADKAALKAALGLKANKIYGNGRIEAITADDAQLTINVDAVDLTKEGEYTVKVGYANFTQKEFTVKVFAVDTITANMFALDSSRATKHVQTVFVTGDTFNSKNLSVVAHAKCGEATKDFTVNKDFLAAKDDNNLVTVTYQGKTTTYQTYTLAKAVAKEGVGAPAGVVSAVVDPTLQTVEAGKFQTITQALQWFEASKLDAGVMKAIALAEGTYNEKVYVTLPNVYIQAKDSDGDFEKSLANADKYVIVYDRLAGQLDPSGQYLYSTDGSATFTVAESATGFSAVGVTFKNYYNNNDLYNESKTLEKAVMKDTQAVALLVRADKSAFVGCKMSSYHDTLYADKGRQLYDHCYIEGRTDYIFGGGTVTAYFGNSTIHTLVGDLNDEKTAAKSGNGGYVACTKGSNSAYDYIFDGCTFEADSTVLDGSVSLGRTWDTGMKLMIMNSTISKAYSKYDFKTGHKEGDITFNDRYTEMNSGKSPKAANIFEFNNTGDSALTATEAAEYKSVTVKANDATDVNGKYNNPLVIFGAKNGETQYDSNWNEAVSLFAGTYTKATLTIHVGDKTVAYAYPLYVGSTMSEDYVKSLFEVPEGFVLTGLFSNEARTTAFDFTKALAATNNIYVGLAEGSPVTFSYSSTGENANVWTEKFDETADPIKSADSTPVEGKKITGDYVIELAIPATKYVNFESLKGFTNGSSEAKKYATIKLMNGDTVVKTIDATTPASKKFGSFTFTGTETSAFVICDSAVNKVVFTCNTANKGYALTEIKVQAYVKEMINKTFDATKLTNASEDKEKIVQTELDSFFTLVGSGDKRSSTTGGAVTSVEFKDAGLQFKVGGKVTVTATVASTGTKNTSLVALYKGNEAVAPKTATRATGDVIGITANVVDVYLSGTNTVIVWEIPAGTYTLKGIQGTSTGGTADGTAVASAKVERAARFIEVKVESVLDTPTTPEGGQGSEGTDTPAQQATSYSFTWNEINTANLTENGKYYTDSACTTESDTKRYDQTTVKTTDLQAAFNPDCTLISVEGKILYRDGVSGSGTLYYDSNKSGNNPKCIEINKAKSDGTTQGAIVFTVTKATTVKVGAASTGGTNTSKIEMLDSTGAAIAGVAETGTDFTVENNVYSITGTATKEITYTLAAGTYKLTTPESGRNVRIMTLVIEQA